MRISKEKMTYQLAFMPNWFPVNCYIIEEETELTLIDAALSFSVNKIIKTAQSLNKPITRIVLTHAHADHVGALDQLKQLLPGAAVYISKRDARLLNGDKSLEDGEGNLPIKGGVPKNIKTRPDYLIEHGERIGSLLAVSTPGHTPGSMSFLDVRNQVMIVGDAFQTRGGFAVSGTIKPLFPFPALATWNKRRAIESAHIILSYDPGAIACGHGNMVKHPRELIKQAIQEAEEKA